MQGGVHLLSGIILAGLWNRKEYKFAAVLGAILPDFDIFIAGIGYLFAGEEAVYKIHRSFSHSLFIIGCITLSLIIASFFLRKKENFTFDLLGFAIGLGIGMVLHSVLDIFYLSYVRILWPFSDMQISYPIVSDSLLSDLQLKLLHTSDFYTDIFFFHLPMLILAFKKDLLKKIRIPILIYLIIETAVITFFIIYAIYSPVSLEDFIVYLYFPGMVFLLFSVFSPLIFRKIILDLEQEKWYILIFVALFAFSQFLFFI